MLGIIITIIWVFAYGEVVPYGEKTMEAGFLSGMDFLWFWYWGCVAYIIAAMLIEPEAITLATGGGIFFVLTVTIEIVVRVLLLCGTYLLMTAGTLEMNFTDFSINKLIFGTLLLAVGLIIQRSLLAQTPKRNN